MSTLKDINKACTFLEKGFNFAGSVPLIPAFSGAIRAQAGTIQAIAASIFAIGAGIAELVERNRDNPDQAAIHKMRKFRKFGVEHIFHGALNIIRGLGEAALGVLTFGLLNLATFLPLNLLQKPKFSPIFKYS